MNPLGNRARAEEFARLLEGAVASSSVSSAGLAALAARLRAVAPGLDDAVALRPEFRAALRQRVVAVATVQGPVPELAETPESEGSSPVARALAWSRTWTAQKRLAAVSGAMAAVVALTGVGIASSRSLPGQPFYSLKRASESLQLKMADGDAEKGTKHLEFAATRLREVRALALGQHELAVAPTGGGVVAGGVAASLQDRINDTLEDFDAETLKGRSLLEGVYRRTGETAPLKVLTTFATQQQRRLSTILPELPAGSTKKAERSFALVVTVGNTATQLLIIGTCNAACDPDAAGPELPVEPAPTPGTSANPGAEDNNGVPDCSCGTPTTAPEPTAEPSEEPTPEPTDSATPTPSPTPTPTPSPSGGILPPLPLPLPTDLPTILPTLPPLPVPLPVQLPTELPTILPTLGTNVVTKP
jgi:hypothetical protein